MTQKLSYNQILQLSRNIYQLSDAIKNGCIKQITDWQGEDKENIFHLLGRDSRIFDSGSINGNSDMTLHTVVSQLIKSKPQLCTKQEKSQGYTPLHEAFKSGNIELAQLLIKLGSVDCDVVDNNGMRAIDLLAFRVDDDHKTFIKESPLFEKNFKIKKVFEAYSWGRSEDFMLGYATLKDEQVTPRQIYFQDAEGKQLLDISIRDVYCADSYTVALSEKGEVYTWGRGTLGHLGNGSETSEVAPYPVQFDFKEDYKKIKKSRSQINQNSVTDTGLPEDEIFMRDFLKHAKSRLSKGKQQIAIDSYTQLTEPKSSQQCDRTEVISALMKLDRVSISKVACSNTHTLACSNTGSIFSWGENKYGELGHSTKGKFQPSPQRIDIGGKRNFFVDVTCGDGHSIALNSLREAFVWGNNKDGQLGFDPEQFQVVCNPRKLILSEYMNSANQETFSAIKARSNYSVLTADSGKIYISTRNSESPFMPLFGKSAQVLKGKQHIGMLKQLTKVFLCKQYLLAMDSYRNVYIYNFSQSQDCVPGKEFIADKKIANEVLTQTNFIDFFPSKNVIWGITSLRQIKICNEPFAQTLKFDYYNAIYSVMSASTSHKNQVVLKMVKQLDQQMIRDPLLVSDVQIDIPKPSCLQSSDDEEDKSVDENQQSRVPSLAQMCVSVISQSLTLQSCLETLIKADQWQLDELKINCLKFISLNIVSFYESYLNEKLSKLPVYLIRDIQNFLKTTQVNKYSAFDMSVIESNYQQHEDLTQAEVVNPENQSQTELTESMCAQMFETYTSGPDPDLDNLVKFRNLLRKQAKKYRRESDTEFVQSESDREAVVMYLNIVNEYIKSLQPIAQCSQQVQVAEEVQSQLNYKIFKRKRKGKQQKVVIEQPKPASLIHKKIESYDDIFLPKLQAQVTTLDLKSKIEDFTVVQQRESKVVTKPKPVEPRDESPTQHTLAKVIGMDTKTLKAKQQKEDDRKAQELRDKLWGYLGQGDQQVQDTKPRQSFQEILDEAKLEPAPRYVYQDKTLDRDFHTKRAWGIAPDVVINDFEKILKEEQELAEKERLAKLADEEYAKRLQEELNEELLIQQAIKESLKDMDHTPQKQVLLSSCLNLDSAEFKPAQQSKTGKKFKGKQQTQKMKYVAKGSLT